MQITITAPDNLPRQRSQQGICELEARWQEEARSIVDQSRLPATADRDPGADPDGETPSADAGSRDFAANHDHYLYGTQNGREIRLRGYRRPDCAGPPPG
jgi:hypothetical protein